MTEILPDTIRRLYTDPGEYIDSDHPSVRDFANTAVAGDAGDREKASLLYQAVRDGIRYNPYVDMRTPETFRASSVLAAGTGYCVGKAALYRRCLPRPRHSRPRRFRRRAQPPHDGEAAREHGHGHLHLARLHRGPRG
jgi:hypothetical protein